MVDIDGGPEEANAWMQWRFESSSALAGEAGSLGHRRYEFARYHAAELASAAVGDRMVSPFRPGRRVSRRTVLFTDGPEETLIAVVGVHEPARDVDLALPYAMEFVGDRDLTLVLPEGCEWPTLTRITWLDHHIRVFTYRTGTLDLAECSVPLQADVMEAAVAGPAAPPHSLTPAQAGWADEVIGWADGHPRLTASHRTGYLAWQVEGRKVLEIRRAAGGRLRIAAGVAPGSDSAKATGQVVEVDGPIEDPTLIREHVRRAIAARLHGDDTTHIEHRFQARLLELSPDERMGLTTLAPEFPAMRPRHDGFARGFIDFVGVDADGRLHVVETKVGASESSVLLQALDYWVWVEANRSAIAAELDADPDRRASLDVVVLLAPDGALLHRHNRHIAERLKRSVPLRVWTARGDLDGRVQLSEAPFGATRASETWPSRMRRRAIAATSLDQPRSGPDEPLTAMSPLALEHATELRDRGELHSHVYLPHSSQRFALELFSPLDEAGVSELLARTFGPVAEAAGPVFEWSDPDDVLQESTRDRPSRTTVDVLLEGTTIDQRRVALLVEVKLTETAFGGCSHAEVAPTDARLQCSHPGAFGDDPERCWQLRNRDAGSRRRYDEFLMLSPAPQSARGCAFRWSNQPMRNAALATAMVSTGRYDECKVALTTPSGHTSMRRRWADTAELVGHDVMTLLEPEHVLAAIAAPESVAQLCSRYGLGAASPDWPDITIRDPLGWQVAVTLYAGLADRYQLVESHPGGGMYDCLEISRRNGDQDGGFIHINLDGSIHAWRHGSPQDSQQDWWRPVARGETPQVAGRSSTVLDRQPSPDRQWYPVIPRIAARHRRTHRWRQNLGDTDHSPEPPWYSRIDTRRQPSDTSGGAVSVANPDVWFLAGQAAGPGSVVAVMDLAADLGWTEDGRVFDLTIDAAEFESVVREAIDQRPDGGDAK